VFIALTYHWWIPTLICAVITFIAIMYWLWTGTAQIPKAKEADVGLGLKLPIYVSGPASVGWWAMFITMVGDGTAFASLIFGYFFYWTIHDDYTAGAVGPGAFWPMVAMVLFLLGWALTLLARQWNEKGPTGCRAALVAAMVVTLAACAAGLAGPYVHGMDPTSNVYPATVWIVAIWTVTHGVVGFVMQAYCLARSLAGRMTGEYDQDIRNVALYWHFMAFTAVVTFSVLGLFPSVIA
jgi:cytochrome c oxidase subunit I+III